MPKVKKLKQKRLLKKSNLNSKVKQLANKMRNSHIAGRGSYTVPGNDQSVGSKIGGSIGSFLGGAAQSALGELFGMGSYNVSRNSLHDGTNVCAPPPTFKNNLDGFITICAREYIGDLSGSILFANQYRGNINPANKYLFPRLSQLAPNWEEYDFEGLVFENNTTSGTAVSSTNTSLGTVIQATQYDIHDAPFGNKQQMESYMFSSSAVPSQSFLHPVECAPRAGVTKNLLIGSPEYYPNLGSTATPLYPTNADPTLYDKGVWNVSTVGMQAACTIGELWVSYQVKLMVPKYNSNSAICHITSGDSTCTAAAPLNDAVISYSSDLPCTLTTTTFTLPQPGFFLMTATWKTASDNISGAFGTTQGSNIATLNSIEAYLGNNERIVNSTGSVCVGLITFKVSAGGTGAANTVTLSGPSGMTAATCDIFITRIANVGGTVNTGF
jgi:hypothetical protein